MEVSILRKGTHFLGLGGHLSSLQIGIRSQVWWGFLERWPILCECSVSEEYLLWFLGGLAFLAFRCSEGLGSRFPAGILLVEAG